MSDTRIIEPREIVAAIPSVKTRAAFVALGLASLALPMLNATMMGFSGSIPLSDPTMMGRLSYLLPAGFVAAAAVATLPQSRAYGKIADLGAAALACVAVLAVILGYVSALSEIDAMNRTVGFLGGAGAPSMASVTPSLGIVPLVALAFWSLAHALRSRA